MAIEIDTGASRLGDECPLAPGERDRFLLRRGIQLNIAVPEGWGQGYPDNVPTRTLKLLDKALANERTRNGSANAEEASELKASELSERILLFPNAPIITTHNAPPHAYEIPDRWPNYHTMRALARKEKWEEIAVKGAKHIFLLHNGLSETEDMAFHYLLANWILEERKDAVCIIRPLPGHLTRYPFHGPLSERPLDEYLRDPASVFRQFLRYMVETRWLLSALVPRSTYRVMTGCPLLLDSDVKRGSSREGSFALAEEITKQGNEMLAESGPRSVDSNVNVRISSSGELEAPIVCRSIESLRKLVGWRPLEAAERPEGTGFDSPAIHVVGYSMGGFFAQSVFCTWPFAVASCSNLFAGGALRDLAPTAFAHPEEWQSVLHGLRSELDEARIEEFHTPEPCETGSGTQVLGIEQAVFDYVSRVFGDVFLQGDYGSYSTRLEEFSRRLLFILGGDDPIVRTRKVLDAAPPGGITLHQIGDLSHFASSHTKQPIEKEQRDFWLPEACKTIGRFGERAAELLQKIHNKHWDEQQPQSEREADRPPKRVPRKRATDGALTNAAFEYELDQMVDMIYKSRGRLFIARNQIPTVFLERREFPYHGAAMHHSADRIGAYVDKLARRADLLAEKSDRFTLLIPSGYAKDAVLDANDEDDQCGGRTRAAREKVRRARERARLAKSEVAIRDWRGKGLELGVWPGFVNTWCNDGAVRLVELGEYDVKGLKKIGRAWTRGHEKGANAHKSISVTMLPDVWIALDEHAGETLLGVKSGAKRGKVEKRMLRLACNLANSQEEHAKCRVKKGTIHEAMHEALAVGSIRAIKVSAAELNPRYRGRLVDAVSGGERKMTELLIHWAIAYAASSRVA